MTKSAYTIYWTGKNYQSVLVQVYYKGTQVWSDRMYSTITIEKLVNRLKEQRVLTKNANPIHKGTCVPEQ